MDKEAGKTFLSVFTRKLMWFCYQCFSFNQVSIIRGFVRVFQEVGSANSCRFNFRGSLNLEFDFSDSEIF